MNTDKLRFKQDEHDRQDKLFFKSTVEFYLRIMSKKAFILFILCILFESKFICVNLRFHYCFAVNKFIKL
jgi:hypothetical protein